ncbi:50S ribosomal protein L22 [Candidatus Parcubacteria bacterium]|nr:50S ribosomal protein L22 [Candidatus Parcubacteria bacterium]
MEVKAHLRYLRIAPRKVRLVADLIRGKDIREAEKILAFCKKKAAKPLLKLLKSAIANATHNFNLKEENLFVEKILVNEGPRLKRIFPRARGSSDILQKKMSHVTIILNEKKS